MEKSLFRRVKAMRFWILETVVSIVLTACLVGSVHGVQTEEGPVYLTDSHGASGVVHAFLELSEVAPQYDRYWKGALDWLISVAERDAEGRMAWYMSPAAPKGHPNHQLNVPSMCHIVEMFFAGFKRCGDQRYRDAGLAGVRTLVERFARKEQTPYGTAYAWSHSYWLGDRTPGLLAGQSHGLGCLIDALLDAYEATPDKAQKAQLEDALRGILINLRVRAQRTPKDGRLLISWPALKNPGVVETGYCYGQAGLVVPLARLAEVLPGLKLSDGTTALSLVEGSLRYLMSVAREERGGYVWPYMRHDRATSNVGYGSGTGGIGWAFLRGAQVNRSSDPEFAAQCMKYARGTATYAVNVLLSYQRQGPLPAPGGDEGFGVCGGAGGAGHFLMLYANEVGPREAELVGRIKAAMEKAARLVIATAVPLDGTLACPDRARFKRINIALDYGQTGVVLGLAVAGKYLKHDEILDKAKQVADYITRRAVPAGAGYKFAQFHPLPQ
jgi:hypothetical protein